MTRIEAYLIGGAIFLASLIGGWAYIVHLKREAAKTAPAVAAEKMAEATTHTIEHYSEKTNTITIQAEAKANAIPPSDDLPTDVRSAWLSGLSSVRNAPAVDDNGAAKPAR